MQQRLQLITLGVADLGTAKRFYLTWFGGTTLFEDDDVAFLHVGHGLALSLYAAEKLAEDLGQPDAVSDRSRRVTFAHNVDSEADVDAELRAAEAAGGTIVSPGHRMFWGGYIGYVADPDGFMWEIAHNPGLVFGEDGSVTFTEAG